MKVDTSRRGERVRYITNPGPLVMIPITRDWNASIHETASASGPVSLRKARMRYSW